MNAHDYALATQRDHLKECIEKLAVLPLNEVHEPTGIPVWLLVALVADAFERSMKGVWG